jgi:predicted nucleotidyltransferase
MYRRILENEVKGLAEELRKAGIAVEKIILFGSRLKGRPAPESDIDLLIVSGSFSRYSLWERAKIMGRIIRRNPQPFEVLMMTRREYRGSRFAALVSREGREIRV